MSISLFQYPDRHVHAFSFLLLSNAPLSDRGRQTHNSLLSLLQILLVIHTKLIQPKNEYRLVHLEPQDLRLNERERLAVDFDQSLALLAVRYCGRRLFLAETLH